MGESEYTSKGTVVTTVNGIAPAVGADPRRVAIWFSSTSLGTPVGCVATSAPDNNHFFTLNASYPVALTYHEWGPVVGYAWGISTAIAGNTVHVVELLYIGKR